MTVIAIDGPAGAGKSSVARAVAVALGFTYVDTGAMYRRIALAMEDRAIDLADQAAVESAADSVAAEIDLRAAGADLSRRLRQPGTGAAASVVARYPGVRRALAGRQQALIKQADVVMEGRDIGTVIAPDAEVKIFLTAARPVRARRRQMQLRLPDDAATLRSVEQDLADRDSADSGRAASPMKPAADALQIDSTDRDLPSIVGEVLKLVGERIGTW